MNLSKNIRFIYYLKKKISFSNFFITFVVFVLAILAFFPRFLLIIQKTNRFRIEIQTLEQSCQQILKMLQDFHIIIIKINPDLNSVERFIVFGRDESKSVDILRMVEIFTHKIEDYIGI